MESIAIERFLKSSLAGDLLLAAASGMTDPNGTVKVFNDTIPEEYGYPAVLFCCEREGKSEYALPQLKMYTNGWLYRVWAVIDSGDKLSLEPVANRILAALQGKRVENVSGEVLVVTQISEYSPPKEKDKETGVTYSRLGHYFWIATRPLP